MASLDVARKPDRRFLSGVALGAAAVLVLVSGVWLGTRGLPAVGRAARLAPATGDTVALVDPVAGPDGLPFSITEPPTFGAPQRLAPPSGGIVPGPGQPAALLAPVPGDAPAAADPDGTVPAVMLPPADTSVLIVPAPTGLPPELDLVQPILPPVR